MRYLFRLPNALLPRHTRQTPHSDLSAGHSALSTEPNQTVNPIHPMSHNIQRNDRIVALAKCWHGLESIVPHISFAASGLDWRVTEHPVTIGGAILADHKGLMRDDIKLPLKVFTDRYEII